MLLPMLQMNANWFLNLTPSLKDHNYWCKNKIKAQIQIKPTLSPKIRIAMANDKSVSTNVQISDPQDSMVQEAIT